MPKLYEEMNDFETVGSIEASFSDEDDEEAFSFETKVSKSSGDVRQHNMAIAQSLKDYLTRTGKLVD